MSLSAVSLSCALAEVENVSNDGRVIALTASLVVASVLRGLSFREASLQASGARILALQEIPMFDDT